VAVRQTQPQTQTLSNEYVYVKRRDYVGDLLPALNVEVRRGRKGKPRYDSSPETSNNPRASAREAST
jgi:hypothetical protein